MAQADGTKDSADRRKGVGPLIPPLTETQRPLRQQIFERIRAAGHIPRVTLARELDVSPASVTTITQELIEAGLIAPVMDSEFPLEQAAAAHARIEDGGHIGKIVLRVR